MEDKEICKDCKILKEMKLRLTEQELLIEGFKEKIKALEGKISLDSHNSHKPSSTDWFYEKSN